MGVPLTIEFAKTEEDRQVMELIYSQSLFGRPYVLPPGVPAERVAALRKAFLSALADKELIADAAKARLELAPMSGEDMQALVGQALRAAGRHQPARQTGVGVQAAGAVMLACE